jgi:N-acetylglucosamine kinase-like BadF-type ATPase
MKVVAGCDGGGSSCVVQIDVIDATGNTVRSGRAIFGSANVRSDSVQALNNILSATSEACEKAKLGCIKIDSYVAALAGAGLPEAQEKWRSILGDALTAERVDVVPDLLAVFHARPTTTPASIATIVGTGSIAWLKMESGEELRAGGLGPEIGDEGSGFWIVKQALERCRKDSEFVSRWIRKFGRESHHGMPAELTASFAVEVFELAKTDEQLKCVVFEAAGHIALLIKELARQVPPTTFQWLVAGGVAVNQHDWIETIRKSCVDCDVQLSEPSFIVDPVVGAVRLAQLNLMD